VLSRDGENLGFDAESGMTYRNLTTGKERAVSLENTGNGFDGAFSPDTRTIMFSTGLSSDWTKGTSLYEMPVSGGTPKKIWDAPGSWVIVSGTGRPMGPQFFSGPGGRRTATDEFSNWI
jgi:Tol biopolymer transport system component